MDLTGTEILGYRLTGLIGEGGMAGVWRAEHPVLGKVVAIKVLDPLLAWDQRLVERFLEEARIQVKFQHDGIVRVENFSQERLAILMEFIDGLPLDQVIERRGALLPKEALRLFKQVLAAVGYAHKMKVIHRDVKPSNIMVQANGTVKMTDFGIARVLGSSRLTQTGTSMGTAHYMSPEQVLGRKEIDHRTDIYSMGVTFYEVLTGITPFQGQGEPSSESDFLVKQAHVNEAPPDPRKCKSNIPDTMACALLRAMAKDPDDRYSTCEAFWRVLSAPDGEKEAKRSPSPSPGKGTRSGPPASVGKRSAPAGTGAGPGAKPSSSARPVAVVAESPPPNPSPTGAQSRLGSPLERSPNNKVNWLIITISIVLGFFAILIIDAVACDNRTADRSSGSGRYNTKSKRSNPSSFFTRAIVSQYRLHLGMTPTQARHAIGHAPVNQRSPKPGYVVAHYRGQSACMPKAELMLHFYDSALFEIYIESRDFVAYADCLAELTGRSPFRTLAVHKHWDTKRSSCSHWKEERANFKIWSSKLFNCTLLRLWDDVVTHKYRAHFPHKPPARPKRERKKKYKPRNPCRWMK